MSHLRLEYVTFRYGTNPPVLSDVSFDLRPGQSALLLGDNGSGKSTLGRLIGGLTRPTSGVLTIDDNPISTTPSRRRSQQTIYMSQVSYLQFFRATLAEEIELAARQSGRPAPRPEVLDALALPALDTNPRDLTYPEMWRLQLLLLGELFRPGVLFVDEIVAPGLPRQRAALSHLLQHRRSEGLVTLLAYQREVGLSCDRMFTVANGRISADNTPSV